MKKSNYGTIRAVCVLIPVFLLSDVAAAQKFPEYPAQSASQYSSCQTKNGIRVAIEPVGDENQQKKYFGAKFGSQGFLPVLVVVENGAAGGGLLLRKDAVTYGIESEQTKSAAGDVSVKSKAGETVAIASVAALSIAGMFVALKLISGATEVKQNILVKELRSQTIAAGNTGSGFLYVPVGKPGSAQRKVILNVPLALADNQEPLTFTFELEVPSGGKQK
jgi:hypothetical protein